MTHFTPESDEAFAVRERYARRKPTDLYSMLRLDVQIAQAERIRILAQLLSQHSSGDVSDRSLIDLGCGSGGNLLDFIRLGFSPSNLTGIELLEDRIGSARLILPPAVRLVSGDARNVAIRDESVDFVHQSVVFSSLLSVEFQHELAERMWRWIAPGGAVIWYDFIYDNPKNPDVQGVPISRVRRLFPSAQIKTYRVTLAPPIARRTLSLGRFVHQAFHAVPILRTHILAWIQK